MTQMRCFWIGCFLLLGLVTKSLAILGETSQPHILTDCTKKPFAALSKVGRPALNASNSVCQDSSVQLNVKNFLIGSTFQWKKEGLDIPNATDSVFVINASQPGAYSCVVGMTQLCPDPMITSPIQIITASKPTISVSQGSPSSAPCQDGYVKLTANVSGQAPFVYQWQREFQPITDANVSTLDAIDTGVYFLKITDGNGCANVSGSVNVISNTPPKVEISASKRGFCKGEQVRITATQGRTYLYQWLRDGQPAGGGSNKIDVGIAGVYQVKVTATNGCIVESLPISIVEFKDPSVTISNTGTQLCAGAMLMLTADGRNLKKYQWLKDGQNITADTNRQFNAKQAGSYTIAVVDSNGCRASSSPTVIQLVTKVVVILDSLPTFCGTSLASVSLKGTPIGGVFEGNGVLNATFDPKIAGIGQHNITYHVKGNLDCLNGEASRVITVDNPPLLDLGENRQLLKGNSVQLGIDLGNNYAYQWTPNNGISAVNAPKPTFMPEKTTTYRVLATSKAGCVVEDSITIAVFANVYIPDVFSPNNDGQNDAWLLQGLEEYPDAEVTVFDRWGQAIYYNKGLYNKPFDGTIHGQPLSVGSFTYVIHTQPQGHIFRGQLLLLR